MTGLDDALEAMRDRQRRRLLVAILERLAIDDSFATAGEAVTSREEHDRALLRYHHVHLPKLEALGLIERDRLRGDIRRAPAFEEVRPLVELLDVHAEELPGDWP